MQTIARANRVFPGKENGFIVDFLDVFKYLKRALADYASDDDGATPVEDIELLLVYNSGGSQTDDFYEKI